MLYIILETVYTNGLQSLQCQTLPIWYTMYIMELNVLGMMRYVFSEVRICVVVQGLDQDRLKEFSFLGAFLKLGWIWFANVD